MPEPKTSVKIVQVIFVGSLLLPLIGAHLLSLSHQREWLYLSYGIIGCALASYFAIPSLARRGKNINWFLSLAMLNLLVLTPELFLREFDFYYDMGIQFGYPRPTQFAAYEPDKDLFWKMPPGRPGVNSLGFWGKEIEMPKPAGVYRIMFLGDSVPAQGYPQIVETFLNAQRQTGVRFESINLAVGGYSSYQGRILIDKYGEMFEPNLALISYGWNDHWQAYGGIDSQKTITINPSPLSQLSRLIYQRSRILQGLRYVSIPLLDVDQPLTEVRVSLDEYRDNLTYLGNFFAVRNVPVIFITPPTSHYALGVPDYLVEKGFASSKERTVTLHGAYNQVVREVVGTNSWLVLDLEQELASLNDLSEIFSTDGIHLTPKGSALFAKRITDFIVTNIPLPTQLEQSQPQ